MKADPERQRRVEISDRLSIFLRAVTAFLVVGALGLGIINYTSQQTSTQRTLAKLDAQAMTNHQILVLIESVVGPKPTARAAAAQAHLVSCLYNRIDVDTGHGTPDPTCPWPSAP